MRTHLPPSVIPCPACGQFLRLTVTVTPYGEEGEVDLHVGLDASDLKATVDHLNAHADAVIYPIVRVAQ